VESGSNVRHVGDILVQDGNSDVLSDGQGDTPAQPAKDEGGPMAICGGGGGGT
jgi:hypothetical protein